MLNNSLSFGIFSQISHNTEHMCCPYQGLQRSVYNKVGCLGGVHGVLECDYVVPLSCSSADITLQSSTTNGIGLCKFYYTSRICFYILEN